MFRKEYMHFYTYKQRTMIVVEGISKEYKVYKRRTGLAGAVRDLFGREYEMKQAVRDLNFSISKGEMVGFIGPNGAGKSTTIKMMTGILVPDKGKIQVAGLEPYKNRIDNAKKMGVVFGQRTQLWWDIPVNDTMELLKQMYNIPDVVYRDNLDMLNSVLELDKFSEKAVRQLSLGQRMRADLACAMLHNPEVLYLDEPTIGLDVLVKKKIREFIQCVNKERNTTVIITTHDMYDIEKLCNRVIVINEGVKIYDGNLEHLCNCYSTYKKMTFFLSTEISGNIINRLRKYEIEKINYEGNKIEILFNPALIDAVEIIEVIKGDDEILDYNVSGAEIDIVIENLYNNIV